MNPSRPHTPPRLVPERPLPPYGYVPGRFPHPFRDPQGHSHGVVPVEGEVPEPRNWRASREFCYGVDLFNHGYYWEAHEVWEGLWKACGRSGPTADFLKGLIKLAAAGVKAREGNPSGVRRHGQRAAELFEQVARDGVAGSGVFLGLRIDDMIGFARAVADDPPITSQAATIPPAEIVFEVMLVPR